MTAADRAVRTVRRAPTADLIPMRRLVLVHPTSSGVLHLLDPAARGGGDFFASTLCGRWRLPRVRVFAIGEAAMRTRFPLCKRCWASEERAGRVAERIQGRLFR